MENTQKQSEKQSEWKNRELGALWVRSGKYGKYTKTVRKTIRMEKS
jgi:hypothetical protein